MMIRTVPGRRARLVTLDGLRPCGREAWAAECCAPCRPPRTQGPVLLCLCHPRASWFPVGFSASGWPTGEKRGNKAPKTVFLRPDLKPDAPLGPQSPDQHSVTWATSHREAETAGRPRTGGMKTPVNTWHVQPNAGS